MASPEDIQKRLDGPSMKPPPGVIPNFVDPPNLRVSFIVSVVLCLTIPTLVLFMRMYAKIFIIRKADWADYTMCLAWTMFIPYCVLTGLLIYSGAGVREWNIQLRSITPVLRYANIVSIYYSTIIFVVKLSIILQYLSIFVPIRKINLVYVGCHLLLGATFIFYSIVVWVEIFLCHPREKYWQPLMKGHCFDESAINITAAAFNTLSDFLIILLPQGIIWKLKMRWKRKVGVSAIFLVGFLAGVASAVRLYYAIRIQVTGEVTYPSGVLSLWTMGEIAITQMCGCMPVLPRFFQTIWPKIHSSYRRNSSGRTTQKASAFSVISARRRVLGISGSSLHDRLASPNLFVDRDRSLEGHELDRIGGHARPWLKLNEGPLPQGSEYPTTDATEASIKRKELPILRTVHIETHHETCEPDLEGQHREIWL